jgi:hypothetical protein
LNLGLIDYLATGLPTYVEYYGKLGPSEVVFLPVVLTGTSPFVTGTSNTYSPPPRTLVPAVIPTNPAGSGSIFGLYYTS